MTIKAKATTSFRVHRNQEDAPTVESDVIWQSLVFTQSNQQLGDIIS